MAVGAKQLVPRKVILAPHDGPVVLAIEPANAATTLKFMAVIVNVMDLQDPHVLAATVIALAAKEFDYLRAYTSPARVPTHSTDISARRMTRTSVSKSTSSQE